MNDKQKEKLDKFIAEVKNEGLNFFKYFMTLNKLEKLAILTNCWCILLGGVIL